MMSRLFITKLYLLYSLLGVKSRKIKQSDFGNPKHNTGSPRYIRYGVINAREKRVFR